MSTFAIYILKWALGLTMLYIPFAILLRKETFATFNRILLIAIIAVSAILPAVTVTFPVEVNIVKMIDAAGNVIEQNHHTATQEIGNTITATQESLDRKNLFTLNTLALVYLAGVVIAVVIRTKEIVVLYVTLRRRKACKVLPNGMILHCHASVAAPCSWFNHVVISQSDYDECGREIVLHEEGHYLKGHSWDMLLLCVVKALQWFNPFIYMLANDMKEIHEYEADRHVLEQHGNTRAYQLLLLRKAVGESAFNLANNFGQSSVRKRIMMMARKPSAQAGKIKTVSLIPSVLLFLLIFAKPEYVYSIIEKRIVAESTITVEDMHTVEIPAIENAPLPLNIKAPAKAKIPQKVTGTITAMPLNREAKRLIERYEVNATETYYEEVNISKSTLGEELHKMNVRECSTSVEFLCDKQGDAHSISVKSCNITVAGNADSIIEECRKKVAEAVTAYVLGKKWLPTITNGECMSTIFEAHIIFNFEGNSNEAGQNNRHTMLTGSTPIN